jgi:hypothetical protein
MKLHKNIFSIFTLAMMSASLYAADFQLQNVRVGGIGCPSETTQIILAPDSSAASIIFQQFESRVPNLDSGPKVQRNISMLNCNIFLDVKIPAGVKLDSLEVSYDMRGFATFDRGVQGSFKSYLVSKTGLGTEQGSRGAELVTEKNWSNTFQAQEEDFTITSAKAINVPSQCARGSATDVVSIRLQNTLSSQILAGFENQSSGSITMDSSDIKGGLKLRANTSICGQQQGGGANNGRNCRVIRVNGRSQQVCI